MGKKIDPNNKNKGKSGNITNYMQKKNSGSKTSRPLKQNQTQKRRGRRPKKIIDNLDTEDNILADPTTGSKNNSAIILKLRIDPSKLGNIKKNKNNKKSKTSEKNDYTNSKQDDNNDQTSDGMFKNDIPDDNICHKCVKNENAIAMLKSKLEKYEKKDKINKTNKIYSNKLNFISYGTGKKIVLKKTNIKCWWDGHNFTNVPCVLPELYHNNTYFVIGCFCSFNCALAYNLYYLKDFKVHHRKSLTYKLYREMYDLSLDETVEIKEAPPKEILEDFGGDMTIDVFRRSFIMHNREYLVYMPPMKPINLTIEERNTENQEDTGKEYVLKRSKPLSKRRSIISSMKINMNDNEIS